MCRDRAAGPRPNRPRSRIMPCWSAIGRVGHLIADGIKCRMPLLVIEEGVVGRCRGIEHIRGNAARDDVLAAANLRARGSCSSPFPQAFEAGQIVEQARRANPELPIVARAHFDAEVASSAGSWAPAEVVMGEREIALAMLDFAAQAGAA